VWRALNGRELKAEGLRLATLFAYDALLRPATASNAVAAYAYAYANDRLGTATNETVTLGGTVATLARGMDNRHRLAELRSGGAAPVHYAYDTENRYSAVSNTAFCATYAYTTDNQDEGYSIMLPNGTVLARSVIRDWRRRHLVTVITNSVNGAALQRLGYTHDILDRVTRRNTGTFDYNIRSEVISAVIQPTHTNRYAYDNIGNALWASLNSDTSTCAVSELFDAHGLLR
jgi:hypothetical protein